MGQTKDGAEKETDERPQDEIFEAFRRDAMREFEVDLHDGHTVTVYAHLHDAGQSAPAGHLSFMIVDANGHSIIDRVFSVHVWKELREVKKSVKDHQAIHRAKHDMLHEIHNRARRPRLPMIKKHEIH